MPTYEPKLRQHADKLACRVSQNTTEALQERLARCDMLDTVAEPRPGYTLPLAFAAVLCLAVIGGIALTTDNSMPAPKLVNTGGPVEGVSGQLSATVKDLARNAGKPEDALLQEWRHIQSDLQRLQESIGKNWTPPEFRAESA